MKSKSAKWIKCALTINVIFFIFIAFRDQTDKNWNTVLHLSTSNNIFFLVLDGDSLRSLDVTTSSSGTSGDTVTSGAASNAITSGEATTDAATFSKARDSVPSALSFRRLAIFRKDAPTFIALLRLAFGVRLGSPASDVAIVRSEDESGVIVKEPLRGEGMSASDDPSGERLLGFVLFERRPSPVYVSILYVRANDDKTDGGYYFLPWSAKGHPQAFPFFTTSFLKVEGFQGLFKIPLNRVQFLWELESAEFVACNKTINKAFATKSIRPVKLDPVKDKDRILNSMRMIVGLRKTMAKLGKRNWIFAGTLLGWYRQCSIIPYDEDLDTAQSIYDFEDWMTNFFVRHPLLKLFVKYGLKDDSLQFQLKKFGYVLDLFWMYPSSNYSWLGIQTHDGKYTKKVSYYPPFGKICSGDLHGYLVYLPCDTWTIIKMEYGADDWFMENPKYSYKTDAYNSKINGSWTEKQWKGGEVYKVYRG